jgi:hypothetical protein
MDNAQNCDTYINIQAVKNTSPNWSKVNLWGLLRWKGPHLVIVGLISPRLEH